MPVLVIMKALRAKGWSIGPCPSIHNKDSDKLFGTSGFVKNRLFLQCLCALPQLQEKGVGDIHSGQLVSYYQCLLTVPQPGDVQPARNAKYYKSLLDGCAAGPSRSVRDTLCDDGPSDEVIGLPSHLHVGSVLSLDASEVPQSTSAHPGDSQAIVPSDSGDESEGIVTSIPLASVALGTEPLHPSIYVSEFKQQGQSGHYRRLMIRCPLSGHCAHGTPSRRCVKYRNTMANQTKALGQREPEAYLLAWAAAAARFSCKEDHVGYNPTAGEVSVSFQQLMRGTAVSG